MRDISVILPVKNGASTITRAVGSIQSQGFENWELIVIDDGSTDDSLAIINDLADSDSRIRVKLTPWSGLIAALNCGIKSSSSQYIARMDADDVSHPERLERQFSFLRNNPHTGLVATCVNYLGDPETQKGYAAYVEWTNSLISWECIRKNRFIESPFAHPTVMFRRSLIHGPTEAYREGHFPEDHELWLRWITQGIKMAKLPEPLLDWYDPSDRFSRLDARYGSDAFYLLKSKYLGRWLAETVAYNRSLWIWGAGRITRKRATLLCDFGVSIAGFIDIDPRKTGGNLKGIPVIQPDELDTGTRPFVVSYAGNRGARKDIKAFLESRGMQEEVDYILAA